MPDHSSAVPGATLEPSVAGGVGSPSLAYRPGSAVDFDRLYRDSYPRLKRSLTAVLGDSAAAEDCVQETFVRAFRAWSRWTPDAPAEAWLYRIALNRAHSYRRKMALQGIAEVIKRLGRPEPMADPADGLAWSELKGALRRLPTKLAATVVLRYYHGYTNREIAAAFGISERMVGMRLVEAKRKLRERLGAGLEEQLPVPGRSEVVNSRDAAKSS